MKVEVISKQIIKPSSPTPIQNRFFKLSLLDQIAPPFYTRIIFFYGASPGGSNNSCNEAASERSRCLKMSLSKTLTHFRYFSGRVNDHVSVTCDDEGVEYSEARVECTLSEALDKPNDENLKLLIPDETWDWGIRPLFIAQASFFECGGMSLGVNISHKIADAATCATFMNSWASETIGCTNKIAPDHSASAMFPPRDNFLVNPSPFTHLIQNGITKRFLFSASSIATLQAKASSASIQRPTRVESVCALLWKAAIDASRSRLGCPRPSAAIFAVNLRRKMVPSLPDHSVGNVFASPSMQVHDDQIELPKLISLLRGAVAEVQNYCSTKIEGDENVSMFLDHVMKVKPLKLNPDQIDTFIITSWCKFPIYEADFGWGKPIWVGTRSWAGLPDTILLMDTRDGTGIEAWVTLTGENMTLFEKNEELLVYASLNPSVTP